MLEIVEGKAIGSSGCSLVVGWAFGRGTSMQGAGQRGLARRDKSKYRRGGRGMKRAPSGGPSGTCVLRTLAEWFQSTRLETRTKESNMYASRWVVNP